METNLFDTENETALLGIVMQNPALMDELQNIKPFMFSSEVNKELYTAMYKLHDDHVTPDITLLVNFLGATGKLDTVGGAGYLNYLKTQGYKEENLKKYETLVVDSYKAKMLIGMSVEVPGIIKGSGVDIAIQHITKMIDNLAVNMGGESTTSLIDALRASWDILAKRIKEPGKVGFSTGFLGIDKIIGGMDEGDLWIIAARPSMGKSAWACNAALGSAKLGNPCLVFSYEMTKQQLIERLLAIETGLSILDIHLGLVDNKGVEKIRATVDLIKELPLFIDAFPGDINYITY
jgi:replicative DNA helicase